jgi:SAM-dependent methyltransferase
MERSEYETMAAVEDRHWWYSGMRAISAALLDSVYAGRRDLRILDAGCGTGGNAALLRRYGQVVGLDLAPEALALGSARLPGGLVRGSVLDLPFADASFDLVTSFDVLYHRAVPDETPALREVARVLRPGGRLLIRLPAYEFLRGKHDRAVHTRRRYTAAEVRALLDAHGFMVERCSYINALLFPLPAAQRLLERALPALERPESDLALPPPPVNEALRWPLAAEAAWLARGGHFPFGLSVIALARAAGGEPADGGRKPAGESGPRAMLTSPASVRPESILHRVDGASHPMQK